MGLGQENLPEEHHMWVAKLGMSQDLQKLLNLLAISLKQVHASKEMKILPCIASLAGYLNSKFYFSLGSAC